MTRFRLRFCKLDAEIGDKRESSNAVRLKAKTAIVDLRDIVGAVGVLIVGWCIA